MPPQKVCRSDSEETSADTQEGRLDVPTRRNRFPGKVRPRQLLACIDIPLGQGRSMPLSVSAGLKGER